MNDAPMAEMPVNPPIPEAPPATSPEKPIPPSAPAPPDGSATSQPTTAREQLEAIAAGPKEEATPATQAEQGAQDTQATQETPEKPTEPGRTKTEGTKELGPDKEKVDSILTRSAQLLLDAGDPRLAIAAVARSAAPTPLGTELRRDVLHMVGELRGDKFSPEQQKALGQLQQDIETLKLVKTDPARSEFAKFLEDYSRQNPNKAIPPAIIEAVRTKKIDSAQAIADTLKTDTSLSTKLWEQMKGDRTEPIPNVATSEGLLTAAGLEATPENTAKVQKLYEPKGPHPVATLLKELKEDVPSMLITSAMVFSMMTQLIMSDSGGGGH